MIHSRKRALQKLKRLNRIQIIQYEKKMNHKNTKNSCHGAGNMPFFEINHAGSIVAH